MENNEFKDLEDFLNQEPSPDNLFNYIDLFEYVVKNKKFKMELTEFLVIETGYSNLTIEG